MSRNMRGKIGIPMHTVGKPYSAGKKKKKRSLKKVIESKAKIPFESTMVCVCENHPDTCKMHN